MGCEESIGSVERSQLTDKSGGQGGPERLAR
jgi:hypothetical protein